MPASCSFAEHRQKDVFNLVKVITWMLVESNRAGSARSATLRMTVAALCLGFAGLILLGALGCGGAALWIFVLPSLGPVGAPLAVGAILSVVAAAFAVAGWRIAHDRSRNSDTALPPREMLTEATRLFNEHKGAVLLAALVAGMAAENSGRRS